MCGDNKELGALPAEPDRATHEQRQLAGSAVPVGIPSAFTVEALRAALENFPSNGKPPMDDLHFELVILGFIAEHEIKKPCRNCGTSLTDYRYFKLTKGGRVFLATAQAIEARSGEARQGLDPKDESAVGEADAPISPRQNISDVLIEAAEEFLAAADTGFVSVQVDKKLRDALRQAKGGQP